MRAWQSSPFRLVGKATMQGSWRKELILRDASSKRNAKSRSQLICDGKEHAVWPRDSILLVRFIISLTWVS